MFLQFTKDVQFYDAHKSDARDRVAWRPSLCLSRIWPDLSGVLFPLRGNRNRHYLVLGRITRPSWVIGIYIYISCTRLAIAIIGQNFIFDRRRRNTIYARKYVYTHIIIGSIKVSSKSTAKSTDPHYRILLFL